MSNKPAAFEAIFRKAVPRLDHIQLVFEIPTEHQWAALDALGGMACHDGSVRVGIARLQDAAKAPEKPKGGTMAQQCGRVCNELSFRKFLTVRSGMPPLGPQEAASIVRELCDVESRAELDTNPRAADVWKTLLADYEQWQREQAA